MTLRSELRQRMRDQRRELSPDTKLLWDRLVFQRAHKDGRFQRARTIHVYRSTNDEIDTMPFIEYAWALRKDVYCPRIVGPTNNGAMEHVLVTPATTWATNAHGILEPVDNASTRLHGEFTSHDVIIVPLLAFDHQGYRLGYGGGFYDRFLEQASAHTIGLAYQFQRCASVESAIHDRPLQRIATEERWYDYLA
ncbi:MAG: 5-formyltetrahydrofolate cyclo-ligase [Candidatus Kapaibacteriota bacterium]